MFKQWVYREYAPTTAKNRFCYAVKYAECLFKRDFSSIKLMSDCKREHTLKALASLSKFLGCYETFRTLVKNYGLKWSGRNASDIIIDRLTKIENPNEIFKWVKTVKTAMPELTDFMDLMATTGLRCSEAVECCNLIIRLGAEHRLGEYYNAEKGILEHFRFKDIFIRNSKKVFISFVPKELVERIARNKPIEWNKTLKRLARKIGKLRFGDIREFHGSYVTKYLKQPEIDFLHGRTSSNVFMANYFNPVWISDLKKRMNKAANKIKAEIA